jgi:glycosyltransferase involved in cell wall biosynthesis
MKVLVVTQYFFPETFIINDIVSEMESLGHEVTILTGKPNYPDGKIFDGFCFWGVQKETYVKTINVFRVPLIPRKNSNALNLFLNYVSFVFFAGTIGPLLLRKKKFDLVFVFAVSPITAAIPAIFISSLKKAKLAVWVLDLWPQSLKITGHIKNNLILNLVELMVKFIYKQCDFILVQSKAFEQPIRKIFREANIIYYPNTYKDNQNLVKSPLLPESVNMILSNYFSVVFAGNIGTAQAVETIVETAELLRNYSNIKIVLVGSGSRLAWVENEKKRLKLDNIECPGRFDISLMPEIYLKSKAMLLTLNSNDVLKYTIPLKTQSYMAAAKPIVAAIDGEAAKVIDEAKCGFVGPANNAVLLAENIKRAMSLPDHELIELGLNGKKYFDHHFEMKTQLHALFEKFLSLRK